MLLCIVLWRVSKIRVGIPSVMRSSSFKHGSRSLLSFLCELFYKAIASA
jgi:hypothetical protein